MRFKAAWRVLRGQPVAYRVTIKDGGLVCSATNPVLVDQCVILGPGLSLRDGRCPEGECRASTWTALTVLDLPEDAELRISD